MTRILVVEDSPTQAETLREILEAEGLSPVVAKDAETALALIAREPFDLVVSDIVMPGLSGYELCRRIKSTPEGRSVPVILLTSLKSPMDIIEGLECGADNFLTKPYEPAHLISRIRTFLNSRRLRSSQKVALGVNILFLGRQFTITSEKEQILDLLISTFEDTVRTNRQLEASRAELASAKLRIEDYARRLEGQVQETEARYRRLFDGAGDAILVVDLDTGLVADANLGAARLLRRPAAEIVGLDEASLPWSGGSMLQQLHRDDAVAGDGKPREIRLQRPDGTILHLEASGAPLEHGGQRLLQVILRDVTERRRAEAALRDSNARLRLALGAARMGIWRWRAETGCLEFDVSACQLFGLPEDTADLPLERFVDRLHPEDRQAFLRQLNEPVPAGGPWRMDFRMPGPTGRLRRFQGRGDMARDALGRPMALTCVCLDVTEQHEAEMALAQAQKMEAIGHLTGGIAHDFNNLLAIIIGNSDLLLSDLAADGENAALTETILQAALRGAELTKRLLAFSRRQTLEPTVVDLNQLVHGMDDLLRRSLGTNIEIEISAQKELWPMLADRARLESALLNLAVNARDAMPDGGRLTIGTATVRVDGDGAPPDPDLPPGDYVLLSVSDTGSGMPPEVLDRVFEPFFTTKEVGKGSGLGLSMVYGFAKQSGGHVGIESAVGCGTTVRLYLPRMKEDAAAAAEVAAPAEGPGRRSATILLVEDNDGVRQIATRQLKTLGHHVVAVPDAASALSELETREAVDLLFTDIMMPGELDGRQLAQEARRRRPHLRVLLTSGFPQGAFGTDSGTGGDFDVMTKPYRQQELARRITELLSNDP